MTRDDWFANRHCLVIGKNGLREVVTKPSYRCCVNRSEFMVRSWVEKQKRRGWYLYDQLRMPNGFYMAAMVKPAATLRVEKLWEAVDGK